MPFDTKSQKDGINSVFILISEGSKLSYLHMHWTKVSNGHVWNQHVFLDSFSHGPLSSLKLILWTCHFTEASLHCVHSIFCEQHCWYFSQLLGFKFRCTSSTCFCNFSIDDDCAWQMEHCNGFFPSWEVEIWFFSFFFEANFFLKFLFFISSRTALNREMTR